MKAFKIRKRSIRKDGRIFEQTIFYPLGLKRLGFILWSDPKVCEVQEKSTEEYIRHEMKEMEQYLEWRDKLKLGHIDNETFEQILNSRF